MKNEAIAFGFDTMSGANQFKRKFPDSEAVQIVKMRDGSKKHIVTLEPFPCLLYTSPSPRDKRQSRMPSSA